jgi:hypothetical protein
VKRALLLAVLCAACARETPNAPSSPPITPAPSATPDPGPSNPSPSPDAPGGPAPSPQATPATCPCAWQFGISSRPTWIDGSGNEVPNGVAGGWGFAFSTQHFTANNLACDAAHPNCGGRECNDQRGPHFRIEGPAGFSCDDAGGKRCPRSDPWTLKLGSNKQPLVAGTYVGTASLRNHLFDGEGEPVEICANAPRSTTRAWIVQ